MSINLKRKLLPMTVKSTLLYGCEAHTHMDSDKDGMESHVHSLINKTINKVLYGDKPDVSKNHF